MDILGWLPRSGGYSGHDTLPAIETREIPVGRQVRLLISEATPYLLLVPSSQALRLKLMISHGTICLTFTKPAY